MITLTYLVAYLAVGMTLARLDRGRAIHAATVTRRMSRCPNNRRHDGWVDSGDICRRCVMHDQYLMAFLWPTFVPIALIRGNVTKAIDKVDPQVHRRLQKRIHELEQEAGIR
jgi:hypothetical protein